MSDLARLLQDPDTARCYAALTGAKEPVLDDYLACYGNPGSVNLSSADVARAYGLPFADDQRKFAESEPTDDELLSKLKVLMGVKSSSGSERFFAENGDEDDLSAEDRRLLSALRGMHGHRSNEPSSSEPEPEISTSVSTDFGPPPGELIAVPEALVQQIDRTYAEFSRHGFVTEHDFEARLYAWPKRSRDDLEDGDPLTGDGYEDHRAPGRLRRRCRRSVRCDILD